MGEAYDDLFELLTVTQQQAVARGDIKLEDLLERITDSTQLELCPRCCKGTVSQKYERFGLCEACVRIEVTAAHRAKVYELEAERDNARQRKIVQRLRDEIDPNRPRRSRVSLKSAADYGRLGLQPTEAPDTERCCVCGQVFVPHGEGSTCPPCLERAERRDAMRSVGGVGAT